jgi:hypothetical protein
MRIINLCRPKKTNDTNKYQRYIQSYQFYENTPQRKEYMKEYNKKYREQNAEYIECDCGSTIKSTSVYSHSKTQKHLAYLTS